MNSIPIEQSWKNILSLTQTMEQLADDKNWSAVADSAVQRHQKIQEHFKLYAVGPETAGFYYPHLNAFLQKEEKLQTLTNNARKQVLKQSLRVINNKKAMNAYHTSNKI
ncbi:MAG: hypothetical protein JKY66_08435 [Spongiibacteraceae bacterium]|nr:hypothetical protein [Spongiibacteraceae bacterium]